MPPVVEPELDQVSSTGKRMLLASQIPETYLDLLGHLASL